MSSPILSDDILARLSELDRRIVDLERSPQLTNASIRDGALEIRDGNNKVIVRLGKQANAAFGMVVFDASGAEVLRLGDLGSNLYGLLAKDAAGVEVVRLGQQTGSNHGLKIFKGTEVYFEADTRGVVRPWQIVPMLDSRTIDFDDTVFAEKLFQFFYATGERISADYQVGVPAAQTVSLRSTVENVSAAGSEVTLSDESTTTSGTVLGPFNAALPASSLGDEIKLRIYVKTTGGTASFRPLAGPINHVPMPF